MDDGEAEFLPGGDILMSADIGARTALSVLAARGEKPVVAWPSGPPWKSTITGQGVDKIVIALIAVQWAYYARTVRGAQGARCAARGAVRGVRGAAANGRRYAVSRVVTDAGAVGAKSRPSTAQRSLIAWASLVTLIVVMPWLLAGFRLIPRSSR